jgi:hypothetical protein
MTSMMQYLERVKVRERSCMLGPHYPVCYMLCYQPTLLLSRGAARLPVMPAAQPILPFHNARPLSALFQHGLWAYHHLSVPSFSSHPLPPCE